LKLVAVSQRIDKHPDRSEIRDGLDQRLSAFLADAGYAAAPVPNALGEVLVNWLALVRPAAMLLSGGNDIGTYPARDVTESMILDYAQQQEVPLLGICRGMQMMGSWAGADLRSVDSHVRARHEIFGDITGEVNSYHRLSLSSCPIGFTVLARSGDSEIEAISHTSLPWEGWMWHPEREMRWRPHDVQRLQALFG